MTSRERVKAAIAHQPVDRVPYFLRICSDAWQQIQNQTGVASQAEFFDNDVAEFGPPWWQWHQLAADWRSPDVPVSRAQVIGSGGYSSFFDALKASRDRTDKYHLVTIYGSHFEKAYSARGFENFLADMAAAPAFARQLIDSIIAKNLTMLDNLVAVPEIDGILLGSDWGSQRGVLFSLELWDEMIRPGEQQEYDLIHACGKDVWIHSCGKIDALIPRLIEMGVDVLNPVQPECMDLAALKRDYGVDLTFWGGISTQATLPFGTPEQVRAETRRVRDLMGRGGGYILAPSQDLQNDVPLANVRALLDVARELPLGT